MIFELQLKAHAATVFHLAQAHHARTGVTEDITSQLGRSCYDTSGIGRAETQLASGLTHRASSHDDVTLTLDGYFYCPAEGHRRFPCCGWASVISSARSTLSAVSRFPRVRPN